MEQRRARKALLVVAVAATVLTPSAVAGAQDVGYDPTKVLVTLVSVTADATGCASADVILPAETTEGYEVIASGVDPDDERRSVLATVTGDETAETVDRSVHVEACGFKPLSTVVLSVRYTAAPAAGSGGSSSGGSGALPLTGSNVGLLIALAAAALLLGSPLTLGTRLASRFSRTDAED
jgi:hypothetical protein